MTRPSPSPTGPGRLWRRRLPDAAGVLAVLVAGAAVMAPALGHGASLGPYDWLALYGLSHAPVASIHGTLAFDQIREFIPWTTLAWTQVHHGHLPLWNPYSAMGLPLAFNWQSATFGLPMVVGYLLPLQLAYTASVLVTLVVAGTGAYALARVVGCGPTGAALAGVTFELSGGFMLYLGWPIASVVSWAGWLLAAVVLLVRGTRRRRHGIALAVVVAAAVYAGQPDVLVILAAGAVVFTLALVAARATRAGGGHRPGRALRDVAVAAVTGAALGAPLWLPGLQLARSSVRRTGGRGFGGKSAVSFHDIGHLLAAGWSGQAVSRDPEYLGAIALVLAVTGLVLGRRRAVVVALGALALAMAALAFVPPVVSALADAPGLGAVVPTRSVVLLALPLAVFCGLGLDHLLRAAGTPAGRALARRAGAGMALAGVVLLAWWAGGGGGLRGTAAANRASALQWSALEVGGGLAGLAVLALLGPRGGARRVAGAVGALLVVCVAAFLVAEGGPLWSSSPDGFVPTAAEVALARAVGPSSVGLGADACFRADQPLVGVLSDVNVSLAVREMSVYDPLIPASYFRTWHRTSGEHHVPAGLTGISSFCPTFTTAAAARAYGVAFVLEPGGEPGPDGSVFDTTVGDEDLYRVPGASAAWVTPAGGPGGAAAPGAARPVAVSYPGPASWRLTVRGNGPQVLRLALSDVPGWHASVDGRPLALHPYGGVMLEARVPGGTHVVELHYWPAAFTAGLGLGAVALVGVLAAALSPVVRRRRRVRSGRP
ncbi:MAG TPA: YfhO family protein [Acidimicrobiales bacterium]|nr:YfhO family protein [Acidimicrobiales bacterium]